MSDSPWAGLGRGGVDSRRVDHQGRWNFFWAVMQKGDPALALVLKSLPVPSPRLPKLRSIEVGFATSPGGPTLYIRLKDHAQPQLFETLCRDVVACAEEATTEFDALGRAIGRTNRWHHLLRGGKSEALSAEEQKGLIGELAILERLCDIVGPRAAITAWKGPTGAPKDFELHGHCIEVKSRRAAAQPYIQISNEFQLCDVEDHRLWLCVLAVDRVSEPFGETLHYYVDRTVSRLPIDDVAIATDWEMAIAAAGYRAGDDYDDFRWVSSQPIWHEVITGFPRVKMPLPDGVGSLRFTISLAACEPFASDTAVAERAISEGYPSA